MFLEKPSKAPGVQSLLRCPKKGARSFMFKAAGTRLVFLAAGILTGTEISSASLRQDRDPGTFLERGIEMAHAGIQLAEVATNKAEDARVKHFAKIMAGRQKQVLQTLQGPGQNDQARGVAYDSADRNVITIEHHQTLERLSLLSGSEFDREFIDAIVYEYRRAIRLFEQECGISTMHQKKLRRTAPPSSGEMADVARDLLPSLREQLSDAETIQRELRALR